ncbi:hypothetical protein ACUXZZ_06780 [Streptomyces graminifolii]|uniref:hypothetical protein n=1 Tax=Streptomyces graminifolii TaxID=1266771 RepID=UPI00405A3E9D
MILNLLRLLPRRSRAVDLVVAAALFVCFFAGSRMTLPGHDLGSASWPGVLVAGVSSLTVLRRHTAAQHGGDHHLP